MRAFARAVTRAARVERVVCVGSTVKVSVVLPNDARGCRSLEVAPAGSACLRLTPTGASSSRHRIERMHALLERGPFGESLLEGAVQFGERRRRESQCHCAQVKLHHAALADIDGSHAAFG